MVEKELTENVVVCESALVCKAGALLILTPNLPGEGCGLGDFSKIVADYSIGASNQIVSQNGKLSSKGKYSIFSFLWKLLVIAERQPSAVFLLNYSAWGYQKHGAPLHLILFVWYLKFRQRHMLTFFHELWASTYVDRKEVRFRLINAIQKGCIRLIARASHMVVTSTEEKATALRQVYVGNINVVSVPSNIRVNSARTIDYGNKKYRVLVFGRPNTRRMALEANAEFLMLLRNFNQLDSIDIVGRESANDVTTIMSLNLPYELIKSHGHLDSKEVSNIMATSDFFLSPYAQKDLGKSGTIQAAIVHGVIPVSMIDSEEESICPIDGIDFRFDGPLPRVKIEAIRERINETNLQSRSEMVLRKIISEFQQRVQR